MKVQNVLRRQSIQQGVLKYTHDLSPEELVAFVRHVAPYGINPESPYYDSLTGHVVMEIEKEEHIHLNLGELTSDAFIVVFPDLKDQIRTHLTSHYVSQDLSSVLADEGIRGYLSAPKAELVEKLLTMPRTVYKVLSRNHRSTVPRPDSLFQIPNGDDILYRPGVTNSRGFDFWHFAPNEGEWVEFDVRSEPGVLEAVRDATGWVRPRAHRLAALEQPAPSVLWEKVPHRDVAKKYGVSPTNTRSETLERVLKQMADESLAQRMNGKRVYLSFEMPILIGKPLSDTELLGVLPYIRPIASELKVHEGVVDPKNERNEFYGSILAKEKCWAVFAEVKFG